MDWVAAKSYYIGYRSIDRFLSIVFFHNYLLTWSIGLIFSLILPLLFIFAPTSLRTSRTIHFLIICIVCLSNMCCLYIQAYIISNTGEPNLSYHSCRFIIYISSFAKPIGIYLTLLFSIERLCRKILSKFFLRTINYRQLFHRIFILFILFGTIFILSYRLYDVLKLIPRNKSLVQQLMNNNDDDDDDTATDISDKSNNSTDRNIIFKHCFYSMNIDTYAKFLSFYVIQYWFEYLALIIIILILIIIIIHQYYLSRIQQQRSLLQFSINTKFYFSLSLCIIIIEFILLFFHFIVDDENNNNSDTQYISLKFMLFIFNIRCILLPFVICLYTCEPLKQFFYELFILRPYLDNIEENDTINSSNNQIEPFSSSEQTNKRIQDKLHRTFTKSKNNNNNESIVNDELQADDL